MKFDAKKFLKTKFVKRTFPVSVPDLRDFFPEGEEAVWMVRGLTGQELARANEAADRSKNMATILSALSSDVSKEKETAVKELLGLTKGTPADISKRIEHLVLGSVDPECNQELAVKLCETYPVEFYQLTNKIMELTGQGQMPGKPKPSLETPVSGPV